MNGKVDRRVARTRRLLAAALVELVSEKPYEDISIRDITERADIGYATFFRHYDGKDNLMLEVFDDIVQELESLLDRRGGEFFEQEGQLIFQHVADHAALYRGILNSLQFTRKLRQQLSEFVLNHMKAHVTDSTALTMPIEVGAHHMVSSILGLIDWWLSNHDTISVEDMAKIYDRLVIDGTWNALVEDDRPPLSKSQDHHT